MTNKKDILQILLVIIALVGGGIFIYQQMTAGEQYYETEEQGDTEEQVVNDEDLGEVVEQSSGELLPDFPSLPIHPETEITSSKHKTYGDQIQHY